MAYSLLNQLLNMGNKETYRQQAQGLIEYALIILLVIVVVIVTLGLLGVQVNTLFQNVLDAFPES